MRSITLACSCLACQAAFLRWIPSPPILNSSRSTSTRSSASRSNALLILSEAWTPVYIPWPPSPACCQESDQAGRHDQAVFRILGYAIRQCGGHQLQARCMGDELWPDREGVQESWAGDCVLGLVCRRWAEDKGDGRLEKERCCYCDERVFTGNAQCVHESTDEWEKVGEDGSVEKSFFNPINVVMKALMKKSFDRLVVCTELLRKFIPQPLPFPSSACIPQRKCFDWSIMP